MTTDFEQKLERYADLAIKIGLNLRAGQRLLIRAPIATAPLVRLVAARAYQAGARLVDVEWSDDALTLARFQYAPRDSFEEYASWRARGLLECVERGDAMLSIRADDPDLLAEQDPELVGLAQKVHMTNMKPMMRLVTRNATNWLVISAPIDSWAAKLFPNEPVETRQARLWDTIFTMCRLNEPDPVAAWQEHLRQLLSRRDYMDQKRYTALHYRAPGTDLTIGLPPGHRWVSARSTSENGIEFTPNLPTEEIFTLPDRARVDGVVTASLPLNYHGALIDGFRLTFAEGRAVDVAAKTGEAHLRKLIATDEGASRLGEVALVPQSSPIAQSGLLFYHTLFDENAASHIALGQAYRFTLRDGESMSDEQFVQSGGNNSMVHTDFMIGSAAMDIDGIGEDGSAEPVMRAGLWAFDV